MKRYIRSDISDVSDEGILSRLDIASNPKTRESTLGKLSWDYNPSVREEVAKNPSTPTEVLQRLCSDSDPWVSECACANYRGRPDRA